MVAGHSSSTGRATGRGGQAGAGAPSRQHGSRTWEHSTELWITASLAENSIQASSTDVDKPRGTDRDDQRPAWKDVSDNSQPREAFPRAGQRLQHQLRLSTRLQCLPG